MSNDNAYPYFEGDPAHTLDEIGNVLEVIRALSWDNLTSEAKFGLENLLWRMHQSSRRLRDDVHELQKHRDRAGYAVPSGAPPSTAVPAVMRVFTQVMDDLLEALGDEVSEEKKTDIMGRIGGGLDQIPRTLWPESFVSESRADG